MNRIALRRFFRAIVPAIALLAAASASGQWVKESYPLKAGWNGVWLSQDCADRPVDTVLGGNPKILEIWRWNPLGSTVQFTQSPGIPIKPDASWAVWRRGDPANSTLGTLTGNAAYLINVAPGTAAFTLELTGKPLAPNYSFSSSGLNFLGFPVPSSDSATLRNFETFFSYSSVLKSNPNVFFYNGGALSDINPKNPLLLSTPRFTAVSRGKAYWVKSASYADYYGPLKLTVLGSGGIDFGKNLNTVTVRVKNVTDPAKNQTLTASFTLAASLAAPGNAAAVLPVPLRVRGDRDVNLRHTYSPLPATLTLASGEEKDLVLDSNRALMASPGQLYQSILQVTDSLGHIRVDLPVSALGSSRSGVWVGAAVLDSVNRVEMLTGPETDAPLSTPDGSSPETITDVVTTATTNAGQTTRETRFNATFDSAGDAYVSTSLGSATNFTVTGIAGSPVYGAGTDYTVASSSRAMVTNGGIDYAAPPLVGFVGGGGSGAEATATLSAAVKRVIILNGGSGYPASFHVAFTSLDGLGGGAAGFATVSPEGSVTDVTITNGGAGFTSPPAVDFSPRGGVATAAVAGGEVSGVTLVNAGTGYTSAPDVSFVANGAGSGAAGVAQVEAGKIIGVSITGGGSGYVSSPTVVFSNGGNGGEAFANTEIAGSIDRVTLTAGGTGYTTAPLLTFSPADPEGRGLGADATVGVLSGVAVGVDVVHKTPASGIGSTARITISTTAPAPSGSPNGTMISTVTTTSKLVTLNRKSRLSTRRVSTGEGAAAPSMFPVRLVLHSSASGVGTLLQQAYLGQRDGLAYAGSGEASVRALVMSSGPTPPGKLGRVSSASFPRAGKWQALSGTFGGSLSFSVGLGYDAETNPFKHTYHPDHDNRDARYEKLLPEGAESYTVNRLIQLDFSAIPPAGISDLGWGVTTVGGTYRETFTGLRAQEIAVSGSFILHQVSEASTLITP